MDAETAIFLFGGVFLLISIVGGGFEFKDFKIPKVGGFFPRMVSLFVGLGFIIGGIAMESSKPSARAQAPQPVAQAPARPPQQVPAVAEPAVPVAQPVATVPATVPQRQQAMAVAGIWQDMMLGTIVEFAQQGNEVAVQTRDRMSGAHYADGRGTILGNSMQVTYQWYGIGTYRANLTIAPNGRAITGTSTNLVTGETGRVELMR
jgi:hypothetical protein